MIPASVGMTLFPSFSSVSKSPGVAVVGNLFVRPTKFILFVVTPLAALFLFFSKEILAVWVGKEFAVKSHDVLVLLAAGFFFNCLAHVPLAAVLGLGRPDLKAKLDVAEAVIFTGLSYLLITFAGITGAAVAKGTVLALDIVVLFLLAKRIMKASLEILIPKDLLYLSAASLGFLGLGVFLDVLLAPFSIRILLFLLVGLSFVVFFLTRLLTADERARIPFLRAREV